MTKEQTAFKNVLVCDMDQTLGDWRKDGYYPNVPDFLSRQKERGIEPVVCTSGGGKQDRLEYLEPKAGERVIEHIWDITDFMNPGFFDEDDNLYFLTDDDIDVLNLSSVWQKAVPKWAIGWVREMRRLVKESLLLYGEAHDSLNSLAKKIKKKQCAFVDCMIRSLFKTPRVMQAHRLFDEAPYSHIETGVKVNKYPKSGSKDIRYLHMMLRKEFRVHINSLMIGDGNEVEICKRSGYWDMPLYDIGADLRWATKGLVEATVGVMFDARQRTFQVYDELHQSGIPINGNDRIRLVRVSGHNIQFERYKEGLRLMRDAG